MTKSKSVQPADVPPIPNPHYEALLRMRTNNPGAWQVLSPQTKAAVGYYEIAKREHEKQQQQPAA